MVENKEYNKELKVIVKNAGVGGAGIIFEIIIRFINNIIITQNLGAGLYGLYVLANKIFNLIVNIGKLGMPKTNMRFISFFAGKNDDEKIKGTFLFSLKTVLISSIILLITVFLFANVISDIIYKKPEIKEILQILIFSLPATLILTIISTSLQALKFIKQLVFIRKIVSSINFTLILIITFSLGYKLKGLIVGQLISVYIIFPLFLFILYKKYLKNKKHIKPKVEPKELIKFASPLYFTTFLTFFSKSFPIFFMGFLLENEEIGIYNICLRLTLLTGFASTAFAVIFVPVISSLYGKENKKTIEKLNKTVTKWIFSFTLIMTFIIFLYSEQILSIFGAEFRKGKIVLYIVVLGQLFANSVGMAGRILVMSGRPKIALVNSLIMLFSIILFSFLLIPEYKIIGAGISFSASLIIVNSARLIELYFYEKIHPYKKSFYKSVLSGFLSFFILFIINKLTNINFYAEAVFGTIFYFLLFALFIYLFKIDEDDKYIGKIILGKIRKKS